MVEKVKGKITNIHTLFSFSEWWEKEGANYKFSESRSEPPFWDRDLAEAAWEAATEVALDKVEKMVRGISLPNLKRGELNDKPSG